MRVAAVQLNSQTDKDLNVKTAIELAGRAAGAGADLVVLPEYTDYLGPMEGARSAAEEPFGPACTAFAEAARDLGVWLLVGSIRVTAPDGRVHNTSLVFDRGGELRARYRKVHLFDVDLPGRVTHKESDTLAPGDELVTVDVEEVRVGLSICYDLRFPELYRAHALAGAQLLAVPAAFTFFTGRDHWEVLLRARAIENQCWVVGAGQVGTYPPHERSNGRSMVVDPWGVVVACAPDTVGVTLADVDLGRVASVRAELPSLANRRPDVYP